MNQKPYDITVNKPKTKKRMYSEAKFQIVFVIDCTTNMRRFFNVIKKDFIDKFFHFFSRVEGFVSEFALVTYFSYPPESSSMVKVYPFVKGIKDFQNVLNSAMNCKCGGLSSKIAFEGLAAALNALEWSKDGKKYCFLLCLDLSIDNAPNKQFGVCMGKNLKGILSMYAQNSIAINVVFPKQNKGRVGGIIKRIVTFDKEVELPPDKSVIILRNGLRNMDLEKDIPKTKAPKKIVGVSQSQNQQLRNNVMTNPNPGISLVNPMGRGTNQIDLVNALFGFGISQLGVMPNKSLNNPIMPMQNPNAPLVGNNIPPKMRNNSLMNSDLQLPLTRVVHLLKNVGISSTKKMLGKVTIMPKVLKDQRNALYELWPRDLCLTPPSLFDPDFTRTILKGFGNTASRWIPMSGQAGITSHISIATKKKWAYVVQLKSGYVLYVIPECLIDKEKKGSFLSMTVPVTTYNIVLKRSKEQKVKMKQKEVQKANYLKKHQEKVRLEKQSLLRGNSQLNNNFLMQGLNQQFFAPNMSPSLSPSFGANVSNNIQRNKINNNDIGGRNMMNTSSMRNMNAIPFVGQNVMGGQTVMGSNNALNPMNQIGMGMNMSMGNGMSSNNLMGNGNTIGGFGMQQQQQKQSFVNMPDFTKNSFSNFNNLPQSNSPSMYQNGVFGNNEFMEGYGNTHDDLLERGNTNDKHDVNNDVDVDGDVNMDVGKIGDFNVDDLFDEKKF